jgi:hypothetical protein
MMFKTKITELSVTELAKIAGAAPRSVQHWAASGVLFPSPETNRQGIGSRRLFPPDEVVIACIMQPLASRQAPIGELLRVAQIIRNELLVGRLIGRRALLRTIIAGTCDAWMVIFTDQTDPAAMLIAKPATLVTGTSGQVARRAEDREPTFAEVFSEMNGAAVAFVIDLATAFAGIRAFTAAKRVELAI